MKIVIIKDGPYSVEGGVPLFSGDMIASEENNWDDISKKSEIETTDDYCLCRCGNSNNKPFCDGTHALLGFKSSDNHDMHNISNFKLYEGKHFNMYDNYKLCVFAKNCHIGNDIWADIVSDKLDDRDNFELGVKNCISGRLVKTDKNNNIIKYNFDEKIYVLNDLEFMKQGPLYIKGGISLVDCDGNALTSAEKMTLCRCGESKIMPFCDGTHNKCSKTIYKSNYFILL